MKKYARLHIIFGIICVIAGLVSIVAMIVFPEHNYIAISPLILSIWFSYKNFQWAREEMQWEKEHQEKLNG